MKLHENTKLFAEAVTATASNFKMPEQFIEKDYWITSVLKNLSQSEFLEKVVFKGGTSLSKVFKVIERFSEDIDFAVIAEEGLSSKNKKRLLKPIEESLSVGVEYIPAHEKENKQSDIRKTFYKYPAIIDPSATYVKPEIQIELSLFSKPHPFSKTEITTYLYDYINANTPEICEEYDLQPIEINTLKIERTFFEKLLSLVRHSHYDVQRLSDRVRHFYDIYQITNAVGISELFSKEGSEVIRLIREDDLSHPTFRRDVEYHDCSLFDAPLFVKREEIWGEIKNKYASELEELCWTQNIPSPEQIASCFKELGEVLKKVNL